MLSPNLPPLRHTPLPTPPPPPPHTAALNLADLTSGIHTVNLDDDINPWKLMDDLDDLNDTEEDA